MRIAVVQTQPVAGAIDVNVKAHETWVKKVAKHGADMVFFPELSLLGYEPKHAARLAMRADDVRLDVFQMLSHALRITIGLGLPTAGMDGIRISMLVLRPDASRIVYSKQHLHADELPYFVSGEGQITLSAGGEVVAPAICYESNSATGVAQAEAHYPDIARQHGLHVLMANCVGPSDDFEAAGGSAVWNADGAVLARLPSTGEGALLLDTATGATTVIA
jgi:predicted amidohydrolase